MEFITIAGREREVLLKKSVLDKAVKLFNFHYALGTRKVRKIEEAKLLEIGKADEKDQLKLLDTYVNQVEEDMSSIEFPFYIINNILWEILSPEAKKSFKNFFGRSSKRIMVKDILADEYDNLVTYVGVKVLHLAGYNKKKA